jgi:hypothetical protein
VREIPALPSHWKDGQGNEGSITDEFLKFDSKDNSHFKIELPNAKADDPGKLVKSSNPVTIQLKLKTFEFQAGRASGKWITATWLPGKTDLKGVYTILHELGHCMNQAVTMDKTEQRKLLPGVEVTHNNRYGSGSDKGEKGHSGPHCNFGLKPKDARKDNYSNLVKKGIHGTCIMFGGIDKKTNLKKSLQFCRECQPYIKAMKLDNLKQSQKSS